MTACEQCWAEASRKALMLGGFTADRYRDELKAHPEHADEGDDPAQCNWFFDDGEEGYSEYRPHEFSGDSRTCVNCYAPEPDDRTEQTNA